MKRHLPCELFLKTTCVVFLSIILSTAFSQSTTKAPVDAAADYYKVVTQRADKIVVSLGLKDSSKVKAVRKLIADQYKALSDIQTTKDAQVKAAKTALADNKEALAVKVKALDEASAIEVEKLHSKYIKALSKNLNTQQVDQVKDGMTYGVVPITYKGYLAMIPTLTDKQKEQIMTWLVEAREHAMDAETSDKKHAWFGKYKGRINNYLSAAGYDLNKEGKEWEKRRNAEKTSTTSTN